MNKNDDYFEEEDDDIILDYHSRRSDQNELWN